MDVNFHVELLTNDPLSRPFHNRQRKQPELEVCDILVNCTNYVSYHGFKQDPPLLSRVKGTPS